MQNFSAHQKAEDLRISKLALLLYLWPLKTWETFFGTPCTYPERDQEKKPNKRCIILYQCKVCKKDIDRTYMTSHIESYHGEESKKIKCDKWDFVTDRKDSLYRHERQVHYESGCHFKDNLF